MLGWAANRLLLLLVAWKATVWPAATSSGGPALMLVAQPATVCGPASSSTVWLAPLVKLGGSLTAVTAMVNVWTALVSTPPLAVPPLSCSRTVTVALPLALVAVVYVKAPVALMLGWTENKGLLSLVTRKLTVWPASSSANGGGEAG